MRKNYASDQSKINLFVYEKNQTSQPTSPTGDGEQPPVLLPLQHRPGLPPSSAENAPEMVWHLWQYGSAMANPRGEVELIVQETGMKQQGPL